jgi:hypothetical protein
MEQIRWMAHAALSQSASYPQSAWNSSRPHASKPPAPAGSHCSPPCSFLDTLLWIAGLHGLWARTCTPLDRRSGPEI